MNRFTTSRRDVLKALGVGVTSLSGLSIGSVPALGHESLDASATDLLGPIQVPANSSAGFNYPYYLYVPESSQTEPVPMLVEPNNTGTATDDFEQHRTAAKEFSQGRLGWTRTYSEALTVPLLVPVFPRPRSDPVNGNHYVHALDETTMNLDRGPLNRVDLQLINMVKHAQELLRELSYPVADDILLNGFSASGNFVNRFSALHPDIVRSVTAGGVNGTLLLPLEQTKGHTLNYHIGIADVEEITGEPFDLDSWRDVSQFIYMGGEDENDTIPYSDAWNDRQRQIALDVYGEHMQNDRMPYCESVYDEAGANAQFKIYDGVGHRQPVQVQEDIVAFHREEAKLKQISFASFPSLGDTKLEVHATVFDDRDQVDLRVRSDERGDLTATATTIHTGESVDATVELATPIEENEKITVLVLPQGSTNPEEAKAAVSQPVTDLPSIEIVNQPAVSDQSISVEYAINPGYETESPVHVYLSHGDSGSRQFLTTIQSGHQGQVTREIDPEELNVSVEPGTELQALLVDIDIDEQLATDSVVIGDESSTESDDSAAVTFESQPTEGQEHVEITCSVDDTYEPDTVLTLQLRIGAETNVLLDAVRPGDSITESYSLEQIPATAGDDIAARVVDQGPIGTARTVVVGDTDDVIDLGFTEAPTEDDPTATVDFQIAEEYQVKDTLTLRVYSDEIPGTVPGQSLDLLSPGDKGTQSFEVGDDVKFHSEELRVAIVDDVPLAIAAASDAPENNNSSGKSDENNDESDNSATDDDDESSVDSSTDGNGEPDAQNTNEDGLPGFGISSAIGTIGGMSYLLHQRIGDNSSSDKMD